MHDSLEWRSERIDEKHGDIRYEAHGPRESFVRFEGPNAKADCDAFMRAVTVTTHPTDEALIEQMARAIAIQIYHDEGLETMNYAGESDYADREWSHYESTARTALAIARKAIEAEMRGEVERAALRWRDARRNPPEPSPDIMFCKGAISRTYMAYYGTDNEWHNAGESNFGNHINDFIHFYIPRSEIIAAINPPKEPV